MGAAESDGAAQAVRFGALLLRGLPSFWRVVVCAATMLAIIVSADAAVRGTVLFPAATDLSPSITNPVGLALGDMDGDGWTDIVVSANLPERIVWWRNNGDGTFGTVQNIVTTSPSNAFTNVAVADLNMDGRPDVVYYSGGAVRWTPNLGGSTLAAQFGYSSTTPTGNQFVVATTAQVETSVGISDLNQDGRPDVLAYSVNPDRSVMWIPNLASGFGARVVFSNAGIDPSSIQGVDVDQDGFRDIAFTSTADSLVAWYRNNGNATFGSRQTISNVISLARNVAFADLNGDARIDAWCLGSPLGSTSARWFAQNAVGVTPRFSTTANIISTFDSGGGWQIRARDMNSDGRLDAVMASPGATASAGRVVWVENLGAGNFGTSTANRNLIGTLSYVTTLEVEDLDKNGTLDVVGTANGGAKATVFWNRGGQTDVVTADTAPATLMAGRRDDFLRITVTSRGIAGDAATKLDTLSLRLESSAGVPLTTVQANALLDRIALHLDADSSGTFDPAVDPAVATVTDLVVTAGVLTFPFSGAAAADVQISPGATRTWFVVPKMGEFAAAQTPNTVRISHVSHGTGRSVMKDATTDAPLTVETATIVNAPSAVVTSLAANTYGDYAFLYFDSDTAPGTAATDDFDGDGTPNLAEFGFGMDPSSSNGSALVVSGNTIVQRGVPVAVATSNGTGVSFQAMYVRRKNPLANLSYAVQFSATLASWVTSTATPTVVADDGVFEVVSVPYPFFVNGRKARFFRVQVTSP